MMRLRVDVVADAALVSQPKLMDKTLLDEEFERVVNRRWRDDRQPLLGEA